jgi:hypothetical protein
VLFARWMQRRSCPDSALQLRVPVRADDLAKVD